MKNLPKSLRTKLETQFSWKLPEVIQKVTSTDGATKLLLQSDSKFPIESVIIRYDNRTSLCVSSQVGCKLACSFCQTGKLGFFRHLTAAQITGQLRIANDLLRQEGRRITHIVFMGMGEPLDNANHIIKAVNLFCSPEAYGLSPRKVTISTAGLCHKIDTHADQTKRSCQYHGNCSHGSSSILQLILINDHVKIMTKTIHK